MMETRHGRAFYDAQGQKCEDGPGPCPHCGNRHVFGSGEEIFIAKTVEERAIEFLIERAESAVIERIVWEDIEYSY
jgi:hypothetical protein